MNNYLSLQFDVLANKEFYHGTEDDLPKHWKMKDGHKIKVTDMETSHINNTLRLIRRGSLTRSGSSKWVRIFENELTLRNEK